MSDYHDGGPAFPFTPTDKSGQIGPNYEGMSLRDWFAGMALQGILASTAGLHMAKAIASEAEKDGVGCDAKVAAMAVDVADAMLAARERKEDAK